MTIEQWIEAVAGSCRERTTAIRIYRRVGVREAIEFLEKTKYSNLDTLRMFKERLEDGKLDPR